ncbi:MAG: alkaline phosphatase family protein [Acidobacteriaceae bacterium]|nr:alkaline phosphatase family protein [Acidobacteriaceae bacterium]MBV9778876.1 alkaline phosphatase family protein [Acidobacteriaceae bacterium]
MSARRFTILAAILLSFLASTSFTAIARPKLIVAIIIDQFRYDYLTRFRSDYHGGLNQLITRGADFTNAFYTQVPTVTAVGHSIFMSGAMPAVSGIIGNSWYERAEAKIVTSVCDWEAVNVGAPSPEKGPKCTDSDPASPRRLLVSTIGDELRNAREDSKVIGVSIKARGAILPSGHRAAAAYWFDDASGNFITSSFYTNQLPSWASLFNNRKLPAKYIDQKWPGFPNWNFHGTTKAPYERLPASPWGNELIEQFAEQAITGEKLGQRGPTDLLTISFSSNDYIGHAVGPDAPEVRDMAIRTDQQLGKLFAAIDKQVGLQNVVIVLSADHGVAPLPAVDKERKMPGGYVPTNPETVVRDVLTKRFGPADWLIPAEETSLYLNRHAIEAFKTSTGNRVTEKEVYDNARDALLSAPELHVARVYTRDQLDSGLSGDFIARAEMNGYYPPRSGDIFVVIEPNYLPGTHGTSHFSPYNYDRHVPVLFMGPGVKPGRYDEQIEVNDIAPTLAAILDIETPSGSSGRVLTEILAH